MRILKGFLMLVLLLTIAAGGVYVASNRGLISNDIWKKVPISQFQAFQPHFNRLASFTGTQATQLSSKATDLASQSGAVLGSSTLSEKDEPPLPQRAFERARYSYCQEVIKDYENRF